MSATYQISSDGQILTYPDAHTEPIVSGKFSMENSAECYEMINGSNNHFARTKCAIRMYKQTIIRYLGGHRERVIVTLVIPPNTDIFFEFSPSVNGKKRVSKAIVQEQCKCWSSELVTESTSLWDKGFIYHTGGTVEPEEKFYGWDDYRKLEQDPVCASGIHVFTEIDEAKEY